MIDMEAGDLVIGKTDTGYVAFGLDSEDKRYVMDHFADCLEMMAFLEGYVCSLLEEHTEEVVITYEVNG